MAKRTRSLTWSPSVDTVYRVPSTSSDSFIVVVTTRDVDESDRPTKLLVAVDDAVYLAGSIAHHAGYKLVPVDQDGES